MTCPNCGGNRTPTHCNLCEMFQQANRRDPHLPGGHLPPCWPMTSEALAVHPKQVAQANERNRRCGVNVTYDKKGRAIIPDRAERRKLLRLEGFRDNSGGYGD